MHSSNASITRRRALGLIAVTATGGVFRPAELGAQQNRALISGAGVCTIMPRTTAGPFYFDPKLDRSDITEGLPGVRLGVRLQVVDAGCAPIAGARVDIWHCDAEGIYSGYPRQPGGIDTTGKTFLRGTQFAGDDGIATFSTIYPGWYPGRTPHIHFTAFPRENQELTGQLFFPDALSQEIFSTIAPYNKRAVDGATFNGADGIARRAGETALAALERQGDMLDAALVIAVAG